MKNRAATAAFVALVLFGLSSLAMGDTKSKKVKKVQISPTVAMLPASDAVATVDVRRFFDEALPRILSGNQPILSEINAKLDEIQAKIGIDLRQFDQLAIGVAIRQISPKEYDMDPVAIARGNYNTEALVAIARLASNGTYREESISGHTVYIFSVKDVAKKNAPSVANSKVAGAVDRAVNGLTREIAITSIDKNTLALGSVARVRQTLVTKGTANTVLTGFLSRKPNTVMSFAAKTPAGLSKVLPLDNDELGKNIDSIRFLSGSMDVTGESAVLQLMAKTVRADQAQSLLETLQGLQMVGKAFLGGSKSADKQVYARMIDNAQFARTGTEVTFDLSVPQTDIDILVGGIKK